MKVNNLNCIFLIETKCGVAWMEQLCQRLGFHKYHIIEPVGRAEGLSIMWNGDVDIEWEWKSGRIIHCMVKDNLGVKKWNLIAGNGTPYLTRRKLYGNIWKG